MKHQSRKGEALAWLRDHAGYDGDECLIWPFFRNEDGYGRVHYEGRNQGAHRIMCGWAHGEPPAGKADALHSCGRGRDGCVNKRHLRWGSQVENAADRAKDGTETCGSAVWSARLTAADVQRIKARVDAGEMQKVVARDYGIHRSHVSKIMSGKKWALALGSAHQSAQSKSEENPMILVGDDGLEPPASSV